jgi:multimeric flavodoxin WrbA
MIDKPLILGLSASLRNRLSHDVSDAIVEDLKKLPTSEDLDTYINKHTQGSRRLSNSGVCLFSALWAAFREGADIEHISLSDHFTSSGEAKDIDKIKAKLCRADGIILSTPVYFGDRSSLSQNFIEMIRSDNCLRESIAGKLYAGIAVGAKRNGGQETTLIYQMLDLLNIGFIAVGNDSITTSQYGGTGHAGDIGDMPNDRYGINTSLGTGRRISRVATLLKIASPDQLLDDLRVGFWVLQDRDDMAKRIMEGFLEQVGQGITFITPPLLDKHIRPCIACDICPTSIGPDEKYRCIITSSKDGMMDFHKNLILSDVIMPVLFSPKNRTGLISVYQQFMERTRYLRRGDYVFTDRLVSPFVFAEVGSNENLHIRMLTSFIRHHTVMIKPIIGWIHDGRLLNHDEVKKGLYNTFKYGRSLLTGRLNAVETNPDFTIYQPVGYVLSSKRNRQKETLDARERAMKTRLDHLIQQRNNRMKTWLQTGISA